MMISFQLTLAKTDLDVISTPDVSTIPLALIPSVSVLMASKVTEDSVLPEILNPPSSVLQKTSRRKQSAETRQNAIRTLTASNQSPTRDITVNVSQASMEMESESVFPQTSVTLLFLMLATLIPNVFTDKPNKLTSANVSKDLLEMVLDVLLMHNQEHAIRNPISVITTLNVPLM